MPGGERAVWEPWRMAFSLLYTHFGDKVFTKNLEFLKQCSKNEKEVVRWLLQKKINSPLTSSCGRLFDAIASLLNITHRTGFEAEGPIRLEQAASASSDSRAYTFEIGKAGGLYLIGYRRFLEEILKDIAAGKPKPVISRKFHNALALMIRKIADRLRAESGIKRVVLSGGVFQNKVLYGRAVCLLKEAGYNVLEAPPEVLNDLGICIGQTYVAANVAESVK
jgi:hydrogenase maturation protein HypF